MKKSGTDSAPRVLVVDDEPDLRNLYELSLVREGYQILAAGSVAEARALMAEQSFDVLITDMNLPDGQGLELLHDIARGQRGERSIVITAYGSAENAVESLKSGAFDYLTKPVDLKQFRAVVRDAVFAPKKAAAIAPKPGAAAATDEPELQGADGLGIGFPDGGGRVGEAEPGGQRRSAFFFHMFLQAAEGFLHAVVFRGMRENDSQNAFPRQGGTHDRIRNAEGDGRKIGIRGTGEFLQAVPFTVQHSHAVRLGIGKGEAMTAEFFPEAGAGFPGKETVQSVLEQDAAAFLQGQTAGPAFLGQSVQDRLHLAHFISLTGAGSLRAQGFFGELSERLILPV